MKESIKSTAIRFKNHVSENKAAYVWASLSIGILALQQRNIRSFYNFLESEGIDPMKFYASEFYDELH